MSTPSKSPPEGQSPPVEPRKRSARFVVEPLDDLSPPRGTERAPTPSPHVKKMFRTSSALSPLRFLSGNQDTEKPLPRAVDGKEKEYVQLLSFLAAELLTFLPSDPLSYLMNQSLTFPFAGGAQAENSVIPPSTGSPKRIRKSSLRFELIDDTNKKSIIQRPLSDYRPVDVTPCCTYELLRPFEVSSRSANQLVVAPRDAAGLLQAFLDSPDVNLLVIVGEETAANRAQNPSVSNLASYSASLSLCDCTGSGKSRLAQWLECPGALIHKRKVLKIGPTNIAELFRYLQLASEEQQAIFGSCKGDGSVRDQLFPDPLVGKQEHTLTLIDEIEPPHYVLHALLQHRYFRSESEVERTLWMGVNSPHLNPKNRCCSVNKTILFTRPDVFFKWPVPCPIYTLERLSAMEVDPIVDSPAGKRASGGLFSFSDIGAASLSDFTQPKNTPSTLKDTGAQKKAKEPAPKGLADTQKRVTASFPQWLYHEPRDMFPPALCEKILSEIRQFFEETRGIDSFIVTPLGIIPRGLPITLGVSPTFVSLKTSRYRGELALAQYIINSKSLPQFDLSEFPNLLIQMAFLPRCDVFIIDQLSKIHKQVMNGTPSRLAVGNLLCLVVAAQQSLATLNIPVTASDLLGLYHILFYCCSTTDETLCDNEENGEMRRLLSVLSESMKQPSVLAETLTYLDLQNLVLEKNVHFEELPSLFAHNLLDVRGAAVPRDTLQALIKGTTLARFRQNNFPKIEPTVVAESTYGHPVILLHDATEVGQVGYTGHGKAANQSQISLRGGEFIIRMFLAKAAVEGVTATILVTRHTITAQLPFAKADSLDNVEPFQSDDSTPVSVSHMDSPDVLWTVTFVEGRGIESCVLLSESGFTGECRRKHPIQGYLLAVVLEDGSVCIFSIDTIPAGAVIFIGKDDPQQRKEGVYYDHGFPDHLSARHPSQNSIVLRVRTPTNLPTSDFGGSLKANPSTLSGSEHGVEPTDEREAEIPMVTLTAAESNDDLWGRDTSFNVTPLSGRKMSQTSVVRWMQSICERSIISLGQGELNNNDPFLCAISSNYVAVVSRDADIVTVANYGDIVNDSTDGALKRNSNGAQNQMLPIVLESKVPVHRIVQPAESKIVCSLAIVADMYLICGCEGGIIEVINFLSTEREKKVFHSDHHEKAIGVLRSLERPRKCADLLSGQPDSPHFDKLSSDASFDLSRSRKARRATHFNFFISGSDDSAMCIFCIETGSFEKTIRVHTEAIVDISAQHVFTNGILISQDRGGCVMVMTVDPNDLHAQVRVIWTSKFTNLKSIHLSPDASWLACTRHQHHPLALPIADWVKRGTGQFHSAPISVLHITANEDYLLTGGCDGAIFVWDLVRQMQFVTSFREHHFNSAIVSISVSTSGKVASSDTGAQDKGRLIHLWQLLTGDSIRILSRFGSGACYFLPNDLLLIQTADRGLKILDIEGHPAFIANNSMLADGVYDVFYAPLDLYNVCLKDDVKAVKKTNSFSSSSSSSEDQTKVHGKEQNEDQDEEGETLPVFKREAPSSTGQSVVPPEQKALLERYFLGIATGNNTIDIYSLDDLSTPKKSLVSGELEDAWGDDEEVFHEDTIRSFAFLPSRRTTGSSVVYQHYYDAPQLFLAATASDDLKVIVWNWRRQEPLKVLEHTNFVNCVMFFYPPHPVKHFHSEEDNVLLERGDTYRVLEEAKGGNLVCSLLTAQQRDSSSSATTLHVFEIRDKNAAVRKAVANMKIQQLQNGEDFAPSAHDAFSFQYQQLQISEVCQAASPAETTSSVQCVAIRRSDGLICTGHDGFCQVVFWKWMPLTPSWYLQLEANRGRMPKPPSDSASVMSASSPVVDEGEFTSSHIKTEMSLRPLRRSVSRL